MKYYYDFWTKLLCGVAALGSSFLLPWYFKQFSQHDFSAYYLPFYFFLIFWIVSVFLLIRVIWFPRLIVSKKEIIIQGMRRKVISIEQVKELSLDDAFVYLSYREDDSIRKLSFSIMESKEVSRVYIHDGRFYKVENP